MATRKSTPAPIGHRTPRYPTGSGYGTGYGTTPGAYRSPKTNPSKTRR